MRRPALRHASPGFLMSRLRFTFRLLAAVAVVCALATAAHAARVGVLSNKLAAATAADFGAKISGHTFTGVDVAAGVPTLDSLVANFDVLLLFEDGVFANAPAVGNVAAQFARGGRTVVLGTFYDQDRSDATGGVITPHGWGDLEAIDPNTTDGVGTSYAVRTLAGASIVRHPLTRGVQSLAALRGDPGPYAGGNEAKSGSAVVAAWSQPNVRGRTDPAIAYKITRRACVIHIGIAPHYGVLPTFGTFGVDFSGDFYRVWKNAFDFGRLNCRENSVPTLSDWALAALALAIAAFAFANRRSFR
jgi:hypothetical protein